MHLIYFDESGNTGNNLNDRQQPIFVLCALAVPEDRWLQVEKGFFIDSSKSVILQLCDLCALTLRKKEEGKSGFRDNPLHHGGIALLEPLVHRGNEAWQDVLRWISDEKKKKRPGTMS
jgi:hypothetical protein